MQTESVWVAREPSEQRLLVYTCQYEGYRCFEKALTYHFPKNGATVSALILENDVMT